MFLPPNAEKVDAVLQKGTLSSLCHVHGIEFTATFVEAVLRSVTTSPGFDFVR